MSKTQPPERLLPIDIERMKQIMHITVLKYKLKPVEAVYMNPKDLNKLLKNTLSQPYPDKFSMGGIDIFSDPIVTPGIFFICEPGLFEVYKKLKTSPYTDKNWNDSRLQNIAVNLWELDKKSRDRPEIEWLFTEGARFPTGARFKPEKPIDFIDIEGQKF